MPEKNARLAGSMSEPVTERIMYRENSPNVVLRDRKNRMIAFICKISPLIERIPQCSALGLIFSPYLSFPLVGNPSCLLGIAKKDSGQARMTDFFRYLIPRSLLRGCSLKLCGRTWYYSAHAEIAEERHQETDTSEHCCRPAIQTVNKPCVQIKPVVKPGKRGP